jgi:hypothetical protein
VSYDPDQYFPIMHALLWAERDGRLDAGRLAESAARLRRVSVRENSAKLLGK